MPPFAQLQRGVRVALQLVLGMTLGLGGAMALGWLERPRPGTSPQPVAVPDSEGRLQHVAVHYTLAAGPYLEPTYRDLVGSLPDDVLVTVVVEDLASFRDLLARLDADGVPTKRLQPLVTGFPITPWSRDRYTLARAGARWLLVIPEATDAPVQERLNDWMVPWHLADADPDTSVLTVPLRFDGGDLLVTGTHVFASYRLLERNLGRQVMSRDQLVARLEGTFGKPVFVFGEGPSEVPSHHLGMYITPLPDGRVVVGDPDAASHWLSDAELRALDADLSEANRQRFRNVAEAFTRAGFRVERIPLVPLAGELNYVTYNNLLMETRDGAVTAWVPTYGLAKLDQVALQRWAELGVRTHAVDVSRMFRFNGSVRCLVNPLRREPVESPAPFAPVSVLTAAWR